MSETEIIELAQQCGTTHKESLGVYQFFKDELVQFVRAVHRKQSSEPEHSKFYYDFDRNR